MLSKICLRESPHAFASEPVGKNTLLEMTYVLLGYFFKTLPRNLSASPPLYASAQSKKFTPFSYMQDE